MVFMMTSLRTESFGRVEFLVFTVSDSAAVSANEGRRPGAPGGESIPGIFGVAQDRGPILFNS
jgi:hypothetical protein